MAYEIRYLENVDVLELRASGHTDPREGGRAFLELERHPAYRVGMCLLFNALELHYVPTLAEARVVGGIYATAFIQSPIAMVAAVGDTYDGGHLILEFAEQRGTDVRLFTDREVALAWLRELTTGMEDEVDA